MSGYTLQEAQGNPLAMLMLGRGTSAADANSLNAAILGGQSGTIVVVTYKKTGVQFCNHVVVLPLGGLQQGGILLKVACLLMREIP